jgi:hypothetical protein
LAAHAAPERHADEPGDVRTDTQPVEGLTISLGRWPASTLSTMPRTLHRLLNEHGRGERPDGSVEVIPEFAGADHPRLSVSASTSTTGGRQAEDLRMITVVVSIDERLGSSRWVDRGFARL